MAQPTMPESSEPVSIDAGFLRTLAEIDDPIGVVSILVNVDRSDQGDPRPAWELATRNELARLAEELRNRDGDGREATNRLAASANEIDELLDRRTPGQGRALILGLGSGACHRAQTSAVLPNVVSFGAAPRFVPLVAASCASGRAGLASVSRESLEVFADSPEGTVVLMSAPFDDQTEEWRKLVGPAVSSPAVARHSSSQRDLFARRVVEHLTRFYSSEADSVADLAEEHRWETLIVAGDPRLTDAASASLRRALAGRSLATSVVEIETVRQWRKNAELQSELDRVLVEARQTRDVSLVERARDSALTNGRAALGAADVIGSLSQGLVAHLLAHSDTTIRGATTPDGQLVVAGEHPPGIDIGELSDEHDLVDELIGRALAAGAEVTVPTGRAVELLREHGDIAATLRW